MDLVVERRIRLRRGVTPFVLRPVVDPMVVADAPQAWMAAAVLVVREWMAACLFYFLF